MAPLKYVFRCIKLSRQRIVHGYSDEDVWGMHDYLVKLIPDMLQNLKDNRVGSPSYLGYYVDENGESGVDDICHERWDEILDRMIFLWRESEDNIYPLKNKYEEEYFKAHANMGVVGKNCKQQGK